MCFTFGMMCVCGSHGLFDAASLGKDASFSPSTNPDNDKCLKLREIDILFIVETEQTPLRKLIHSCFGSLPSKLLLHRKHQDHLP